MYVSKEIKQDKNEIETSAQKQEKMVRNRQENKRKDEESRCWYQQKFYYPIKKYDKFVMLPFFLSSTVASLNLGE